MRPSIELGVITSLKEILEKIFKLSKRGLLIPTSQRQGFRPLNPTFISSLLQEAFLYPSIPNWGTA
jgi:hypothetical protein